MCMDIILKALSGGLTKSELKASIAEQSISPDELNLKILSLIRSDNIHSKIICGKAQEITREYDEWREAATIDNRIVTKVLEEYYQIEYCPSFLLHQSLLQTEDFKFALEIYSNIFGIEVDEGCSTSIAKLFESMYDEMNLKSIDPQ